MASSTLARPHEQSLKKPSMEPNVLNVVLGNLLVKPWYPSFYPEDLVGRKVDRLYVCQWCFRYSKELMPYLAHMKVCPHKDASPPGELIYKKDNHAIYEIDGEEHKLFSQNLSLFAKLFLDTKSVFYDVATFRYYLLALRNPVTLQEQVVGFFSKEKMSWDNNNVACILVFPPWQKSGLGQILMGVSYELSRKEGRIGGPEKRETILRKPNARAPRLLTSASFIRTGEKGLSGILIVQDTWVAPEDVVVALKETALVEPDKRSTGEVVIVRGKVKAWAELHKISMKAPADKAAFTQASDGANKANDAKE
ncbi:hypothetical protein MBLNU459_g6800t1 [Dothideomycetes sp. NU459]